MSSIHPLDNSYDARLQRKITRIRWYHLRLDPFLLCALITLMIVGLFILFSASNQNIALVRHQGYRLIFSLILMVIVAHIPPHRFMQWAPWLYAAGLSLLLMVLLLGHTSQGAKRWFNIGPMQIQPSEIMKLAVPLMLAWVYRDKPIQSQQKNLWLALPLLLIPVILTAKQPDLGTALLILFSGIYVILFAGLSWRLLAATAIIFLISIPITWHYLHTYQQQRVLTLLDPMRDPLGAGYNIIQSKIAIGSGGIWGKGWLQGTQAHLAFLPAHTTDFIFAVAAEELGLLGCLLIILIFAAITIRALYIAFQAQNSFTRLLSTSLCLTFITCTFINIGMVIGILPVVGVPLPLISYGGSSMVTTCISFGIIMSIHTHRKLWSS